MTREICFRIKIFNKINPILFFHQRINSFLSQRRRDKNLENRIPKIQNKERRRRRKKEREEYYSSNNRTNSKLVLGVNRCKMIVRADYYKRYYKRWQWDDTTRHDESDDTEIGLLDKDQFCSISVDRRRGCTRSYNSLTTPRDARGWEWIDNAAKMVSGKRDQRIVRLLARRTTLQRTLFSRVLSLQLFLHFNLRPKKRSIIFRR